MMRQDTNPTFNFLALMALSGAVAAFGIGSDTIHVVVGAMLIAPGFEPLLRIVFGVMGGRHSVTAGLRANAYGHLVLAVAAAVVTPLALFLNKMSVNQLTATHWANYWSKIKASGIATSLLAGLAGGVMVSSRMKGLGTGVMVALALIPSMALIGMDLTEGLTNLAFGTAERWLVEVVCVVIGGGSIIVVKRKLLHPRRPAHARCLPAHNRQIRRAISRAGQTRCGPPRYPSRFH
jgi:uncharacterized membrane protein